jgi:hypothetical protein
MELKKQKEEVGIFFEWNEQSYDKRQTFSFEVDNGMQ